MSEFVPGVSHLSLRPADGGGFEKEGIVRSVVEGAGGGEDDLLEAAVGPADVERRAGHGVAIVAAGCRAHPWRRRMTINKACSKGFLLCRTFVFVA